MTILIRGHRRPSQILYTNNRNMTKDVRNDRISSRHLLRRNRASGEIETSESSGDESLTNERRTVMKASVFIATSLDGFIARSNGALDWLPSDDVEPHGYDEFMATVDALVIGRKTYETVLTFDTWPYGEKPVFALSSRPLAPAPLGAVVERMSGDPAEIVSLLAARGIRHVYVDGGITIQR